MQTMQCCPATKIGDVVIGQVRNKFVLGGHRPTNIWVLGVLVRDFGCGFVSIVEITGTALLPYICYGPDNLLQVPEETLDGSDTPRLLQTIREEIGKWQSVLLPPEIRVLPPPY